MTQILVDPIAVDLGGQKNLRVVRLVSGVSVEAGTAQAVISWIKTETPPVFSDRGELMAGWGVVVWVRVVGCVVVVDGVVVVDSMVVVGSVVLVIRLGVVVAVL